MIQIENEDSLNNFTKQHPNLKDKVVVARFKMDGCVHCVNSQPKWDKLMANIDESYDVEPDTLLLEIDSNVSDNFLQHHRITSEDNQQYSVSGYPTHAFITNGVCHPSNSDIDTTMNSILHQLVKNKDIKKSHKETKKNKTKNQKGGKRRLKRSRKRRNKKLNKS
jgi:hypothetical protein